MFWLRKYIILRHLLQILVKLLCEVESERNASKCLCGLECVRDKWVASVVLDEELSAQTLAEGVIGGEIDVDLVLAGRHLVVVFINAAQDGLVFLETKVKLKDEVVFDSLALAVAIE